MKMTEYCYKLAVRCWFLNSVNIVRRRLLLVLEDTSKTGVNSVNIGRWRLLLVLEGTSKTGIDALPSGVPVMNYGY